MVNSNGDNAGCVDLKLSEWFKFWEKKRIAAERNTLPGLNLGGAERGFKLGSCIQPLWFLDNDLTAYSK